MTLNELYAKRAKAWEAAKAFLDDRRDENGILSGTDAATYENMENEISNLSKEIERTSKLEAMAADMSKPINTPLTSRPGTGMEKEDEKKGRFSHQYASDMIAALRTNFRQVSDVLSEGTDANGGYLVPAEWDDRLIDTLDSENIMRQLGTKIKTSGEHKINIAGTKPAASWIEEGAALTFGDATFSQITLDAHKLHVAVKVTEELLYDEAFGLENYLITQFGKAIGNAEESAFLTGNGSGKPTGIFDATNGGTVAMTLSTSLKADDIISLIYELKRPYRKNASWIMNDSTLALIRKLKDGNGAYMWQPSYQAGEPDKLCGYDVHTSAYCPEFTSGNAGIAFGDYSYYNIGDRGERSLQELRELFAGNGMIGYVMKERVDGRLVLPEAVQIIKAAT